MEHSLLSLHQSPLNAVCKMEAPFAFSTFIILTLLVLVIVYLLDINYFMRVGTVYLSAYFSRRRPMQFLEESVIYGRVLPFDSDIQLLHMNNARVLREWDFGRLDLWTRLGLLEHLWSDFKSLKFHPVYAVASVIRYRRPLHMFTKYKIVTKIVYWEGRVIYQDNKIITVNDNIIRSLGYSKNIFPFNIDSFVQRRHPNVKKPTPPKDLELWLKYNEANGMNTQIKRKNDSEFMEPEEIDSCLSSSDNY